MRLSFRTHTSGNGIVRSIALAAVLFVAVAAIHETLFAIENLTAQSHGLPAHPSTPPANHHQDHSCALCELAGTPTVLTLDAEPPQPQAPLEFANLASHLTPSVRDESCFPHLRRAPPSLV